MIREKKPSTGPIVIDLTGPDGNAYALMGMASKFSRSMGLDKRKVLQEMMAGDYENLLQVFDGYFGDFVILER